MSNELQTATTTGLSLYAVITNSSGQFWRNAAVVFEAYNAANWALYGATTLAEQGASGFYIGNFPTGIATRGIYHVTLYIGASPAIGDSILAGPAEINWTGAAEYAVKVDSNGRVDLGLWLGSAPAVLAGTYVPSSPQTDEAGVTTLLARLTSARAAYLDLINTYLNASISSVSTLVNAVKTRTDTLPADPAGQTATNTSITNAQTAILADTALIKAKTNNLPASPAAVGSQMDLINAPNATAITAIQAGLATAANLTTVLNRLGAWTGSGRNTILGALQALFRKDVDATVPADINAVIVSGAGTADNTLHSTQAIRDRGDAAWGSGSAPTAAQNANAVWDALRSAHTVVGSFGEGAASVQGNVSGSVASVTGAVGSVVGNVGGNVVGSVGSVTGNIGGTVPDSSGVTTLLARLTSARAGYLDMLAGWTGTLLTALKALMRSDVTASADIGGTMNPANDSTQAIRAKVNTLAPGAATTENVTVNELGT